jgi:hypothetical protein
MPNFINFYLTISAIILPICSIAKNAQDTMYSIRPDGIGLFKGPNVSYAEARLLYPNAIISLEQGYPGALWRGKPSGKNDPYYFVFREDGAELFRAECPCNVVGANDWKPVYFWDTDDRTKVILDPTAISQKYRTYTGIGVGNKISELRKAYPKLRKLTAVHPPYSSLASDYEFVCFDGHALDAAADSIHTMNFYVRPAPGKRRVGKYVDSDHTTIIDPNATIVGIQPHGGCLLNNVSPD